MNELTYSAPAALHRPALVAQGVIKEYPTSGGIVRALDGVCLEVRSGELLAIMGASGSGKSTLLHLMAGLDAPTAGSILVDGLDIARMSDRERTLFRRRRIGIVFQAYNLLSNLSALENVALPAILDGVPADKVRRKALELLELVQLTTRAHHRPQALSGGEQQRVAIARSLMNDPALVLADEPTGNLDSRRGQDIWRLLVELARGRGCTVVAVTHEASGAAHTDRVIVLKDGTIAGEIVPGRSGNQPVIPGSDGEAHAALVAARYSELVG